jgi:hypothetical protein
MSKFNSTIKSPKTLTTNLAGGQAYSQSAKLELVSILLTSFVQDTFYQNSDDNIKRVRELLSKVDPKFAAQAAVFARTQWGMRSISHVLASELASLSSGQEWGKNFYDKIVYRVDDMTEILSYYLNNKTDKKSPKFPSALKRGFASAFDRFDNYQLSKYLAKDKEVKLVDVVNITHPTPSTKNTEALSQLIAGELKNTETWEAKLSQAGQKAENDDDLNNLKSEAWGELLTTKKLGYFALLRNLRNILSQAPNFLGLALSQLQDEKLITNSKVLPFRFATAYEEISKLVQSKEVRDTLVAISNALDISVRNVPKMDDLLVVIDVSGSMSGKPADIASLFGAILAKANNCDVMTFSTSAQYVNYDPTNSVLGIRNSFRFSGGGTNFQDIFVKANKKYSRVLILSDMQGWIGGNTPAKTFSEYKKRFGANPFVYSWDLSGYGTLQFPESNVFALAGFSEKVFDIMSQLETDRQALIHQIEKVEI